MIYPLHEAIFGWKSEPTRGWCGLGWYKRVYGVIHTRLVLVDPQMVSSIAEYGPYHSVLLVAASKTIVVEGSPHMVAAFLDMEYRTIPD